MTLVANKTNSTARADDLAPTINEIITEILASQAAWTSYIPQVDQGASTDIAKTIGYAKYLKIGRTVFCHGYLTMTAAGTTNNQVVVSLPFTAVQTLMVIGEAQFEDSGTDTYIAAAVTTSPATYMNFRIHSTANSIGVVPNIAIANGDTISWAIHYEATS